MSCVGPAIPTGCRPRPKGEPVQWGRPGAALKPVISERLDLSLRGVVFSRTSPTRGRRGFLNGGGRHRSPSYVTAARADLSYERDRNPRFLMVAFSPRFPIASGLHDSKKLDGNQTRKKNAPFRTGT